MSQLTMIKHVKLYIILRVNHVTINNDKTRESIHYTRGELRHNSRGELRIHPSKDPRTYY